MAGCAGVVRSYRAFFQGGVGAGDKDMLIKWEGLARTHVVVVINGSTAID